jgi:hypothetical protein
MRAKGGPVSACRGEPWALMLTGPPSIDLVQVTGGNFVPRHVSQIPSAGRTRTWRAQVADECSSPLMLSMRDTRQGSGHDAVGRGG